MVVNSKVVKRIADSQAFKSVFRYDTIPIGLLIVAVTIFVLVVTFNYYSGNAINKNDQNITSVLPKQISPPQITATSGLVYDQKNNVILYNKNNTDKLPIASISKVLTAIVALESLPETTTVIITASDLATEGNSGLLTGEIWSVRDLVKFMMVNSSNDAAAALARTVSESSANQSSFSDMMARQLTDLTGQEVASSQWQNPSGLDVIDGQVASNYATAEQVLVLLRYLFTTYPDVALVSGDTDATFTTNLKTHYPSTTNTLAATLPHTLGGKTGFTIVAGGNLGVIADIGPDHPVYIIVLGSTVDGRFQDVLSLYNYTTDIIQSS